MNLELSTVHTRATANAVVSASAAQVSLAVDLYVSWSLVGFATALAALLSNMNSATEYITAATLPKAGVIFIWMFVCATLQKYMATVIRASNASAKDAADCILKFPSLDANQLLPEIKGAYPKMLQGFLIGPFSAISKGDLTYGARMLIRFALIQCLLMLCYSGLSFWALWTIINGISI